MTVLSPFLESPLNFLSTNLKKHLKIRYSQREKQCQSVNCQKDSLKVKDKIACKPHLEWENDSFQHIFGILIKFPI